MNDRFKLLASSLTPKPP